MAKRIGNLFDSVINIKHLIEVYSKAKISKNRKSSKYEFELDLASNLLKIHTELSTKNYKPRPYSYFILKSHKPREIWAPQFQDIIVQHAILDIIEPIFDKTFIEQTHGCRKGHGIHTASKYIQESMRKCDKESYYLQLDIRKYFYSIDRNILKKLVERKIKDPDLIRLICSYTEIEGVKAGVPIGNLLSQFFGLLYLTPLDHFVKRELKQKFYCRYVDDFVILGLTKEQVFEFDKRIREFLEDNLKLEISKIKYSKIKNGINFVGYRTWQHYKLVRKFSLRNFTRKVKKYKVLSVNSMLGHARHTNSLKNFLHIILNHNKDMVNKLPNNTIKFIRSIIPVLIKYKYDKMS